MLSFMHQKTFVIDQLKFPAFTSPTEIPAALISRQDWQERVQILLRGIDATGCHAGFHLSAAEISVHYHRPLGDFIALVIDRLD